MFQRIPFRVFTYDLSQYPSYPSLPVVWKNIRGTNTRRRKNYFFITDIMRVGSGCLSYDRVKSIISVSNIGRQKDSRFESWSKIFLKIVLFNCLANKSRE